MNLNRAYQRCALALAVLGILSYATAARQTASGAPGLLVWALPALCTGWYLSARRSFTLPRAAVNALLTGALGYAILRAISGMDVSTVAELVIFLLVIKVGDRRSPRDDGQIISLSVFLAISAMLTGNSLLVGVQLMVFLPLLVATVMLFQLQSGWLAAHGEAAAPSAGPPVSPVPLPSPRWADTAVPGLASLLRRTVVVSSLGILAFSFLVFVILPRGVGENFLGPIGHVVRLGTVTAFTDTVALGDRGVISDNPEVVFTAEFLQEGGENIGSLDMTYYLRGAVLDKYSRETHTWSASTVNKNVDPRVITGPDRMPVGVLERNSPLASSSSTQLIEQVIRIPQVPNSPIHLFGLWHPVTIEIPRQGTAKVNYTDAVVESAGSAGPFTYRVKSTIAPLASNDAARRTPTSFPSPPVHDLAARILSDAKLDPDPEQRPVSDDARGARMIQEYLRTKYSYTLTEYAAPYGEDPIEHFLFVSKAGHCEYFASAMVALCRAVGINARMVTGYIAAEFNSATGQYVVRQSNAHAWVEAEAGAGFWQRYDPTPPSDLARLHRPAPGIFTRLRQMLDAAEFTWNQSVVGFDEHARERLLAPTARPGDALATRLESFAARVRFGGSRLVFTALARGMVTFALVAITGFGFSFLLSIVRKRRPARARRADPRPLRFYSNLLTLLRRRGQAKPLWRPPLAHVSTLSDPELALGAEALTRLYYRARFGQQPPTALELAQARAMLRKLGR
jgi:transglutaminase-like putative cysteine protease